MRSQSGPPKLSPQRDSASPGVTKASGCKAHTAANGFRVHGLLDCHLHLFGLGGLSGLVRDDSVSTGGVVPARAMLACPAGDHAVRYLVNQAVGLRPGAGPGRLQHQFPFGARCLVRASWRGGLECLPVVHRISGSPGTSWVRAATGCRRSAHT
jgi:hypothetical protein